jgi:hypothetical protein
LDPDRVPRAVLRPLKCCRRLGIACEPAAHDACESSGTCPGAVYRLVGQGRSHRYCDRICSHWFKVSQVVSGRTTGNP